MSQGTIDDMVFDVQRGIGWVLHRIEGYGGDRSNVYVMGQSCGGHLAALALLRQNSNLSSNGACSDSALAWHPSHLKV